MASLRHVGKRKNTAKKLNISAPIANDDLTGARDIIPMPPARARPLQQGGDKTGDLVKRRYSHRFNNLPTGFDPTAPPLPSVPDVPSQYKQFAAYMPVANSRTNREVEPPRPPPSRSGTAPRVDIRVLRDPSLVPDQFVATALADATDEQIREYENELRYMKAKAQSDLQQSVLQNRTQFIKISKEAEKLKAEMRALKNLMAELKTNTTALRSATNRPEGEFGGLGGSLNIGTGMSKRDKRSSVADRSALWNTQLQALFKAVEGAQRFLPATPGRHLIQDAGPWIELDNATYKSRRTMQIYVLNDHLLIVSRKKRMVEGGAAADPRGQAQKLVADRCWPLLDIEVTDMAGTKDSLTGRNKLADAIMVRGVGQESFIYRTEKSEDTEKGRLLLNIRRAVEELRKGLQSEMDANNKAKETLNYFASRDPGLLQNTDLLETLSDIKDMHIEVEGQQQNLRWVESQMDELDIHIALQEFEVAVALVEKMRALARGIRSNPVAQDFIDFKVDDRAARLADFLIRELEATHNERGKTKINVTWLARLGFEDRAREAYLAARSDIIHTRYRQCIFKGDLHMYIWEISYVYFTLIRNTVQIFQMCFPQAMMSTCVNWAKVEVVGFNATMARQLRGTERDGEQWARCLETAREHAGKLDEIGLDFRDLVGREPFEEEGKEQEPVGLGL